MVYIAAPLHEKEDRDFSEQVTERLRDLGIDVYLPHEQSGVVKERIREGKSETEIRKQICAEDTFGVVDSDCVFVLLIRSPRPGTLFECGVAYGCDIPLVVYRKYKGELTLMLEHNCDFISDDLNACIAKVKELC